MAWDGEVLLFIQECIRNPVLSVFFQTVTYLGDKGIMWLFIAVIFLFFEKSRKTGIAVCAALLMSLILNNLLLKNIFARIRPYEVVEGLIPLIPAPHDYSFPSGHTASSFAAAVTIIWYMPRKYGVLALVLASLIALSRLYLGVHYPTDVLGGILGGIVAAYVASRIVLNLKNV